MKHLLVILAIIFGVQAQVRNQILIRLLTLPFEDLKNFYGESYPLGYQVTLFDLHKLIQEGVAIRILRKIKRFSNAVTLMT